MNPVTPTMDATSTDGLSTATTTAATAAIATTTEYYEDGLSSQGEMLAVSILLVVLSIFGTFGNGLVLYVFTRKSDKVTSTIFILSLAWCDFFTCLIIMPYTVANIQVNNQLVYDVFCKLYHFLITCNVPLSAFIMVAVAVDRYFSICHPFLHAVTPRRARISIMCLCLFAFSLGTITACMYGVYKEVEIDTCTNDTSPRGGSNGTLSDVTTIPTRNDVSGKGPLISPNGAANVTRYIFIDSERNVGEEELLNASGAENNSSSPSPPCSPTYVTKLVYTGGNCDLNEIIFSTTFFEWYHKIYISFYIISLFAVFTLYFLIYRSVVKRRAWRRKQKSWSHSPMTAAPNNSHAAPTTKTALVMDTTNPEGENMELNSKPTKNGSGSDDNNGGKSNDDQVTDSGISGCKTSGETTQLQTSSTARTGSVKGAGGGGGGYENGTNNTSTTSTTASSKPLSSSAEKKTSRERRDFNFLANIRTAVMLFVVTIVFIISFLPSWLMANYLIDYHVFVFYMYFIYNVANPVIYAFMNQSFRKELKKVFQRGTHFFRSG